MAGVQSAPGASQALGNQPSNKTLLHTFIYDYFLKQKEFKLAEALLSSGLTLNVNSKTSPGSREVNGIDSMDSDSKDSLQKQLDSLPRPQLSDQVPDSAFLEGWWSVFWDIWLATRNRSKNGTATHYLNQNQLAAKQRNQNTNGMIQQSMMSAGMANYRMMNNGMPQAMANGVNAGDLRRGAMANNRPGMQNIRSLPNQQQQPQHGQNPMQREGSDMDMNGQRPHSPMSGGDNAPSPKRQRIDHGPMSAQQAMNNGRQSMGQVPNGMGPGVSSGMVPGFDSSMMGGHFGGNPSAPKGIGMYDAMRGQNGMVTPSSMAQGSPMLVHDGQPMGNPADMFGSNGGQMRGAMQGNGQQGGALADYQMQLMLLEQQNKKRLLMARQEQEVTNGGQGPGPGGPSGGPGGQGMIGGAQFAAGMSPHGARPGQSPNPGDQMKRGTPKMSQASPLPDGSMQNRNSPAPGFDAGQMQQQHLNNPMFSQLPKGAVEGMMGPGVNMMRPPGGVPPFMAPNGGAMSQQQMEIMRANRGPGGNWAQGPQNPVMTHQRSQQGDNGPQRSNMPPPSAPAAAGSNPGRPQPPSPQAQNQAPPTPSQHNKANPKGKKDTKDTKKKPNKKAATTTGATPNSEAENPPTPTPPTPITPVHPSSFTGPKGQGQGNNGQGPQVGVGNHQQQQQQQQQASGLGQQEGSAAGAPFGNIEQSGDLSMPPFDLNPMDNSDVLDGFDFDSFLHMDHEAPFDGSSFDPNQFNGFDGNGEMGADVP